MRSEKIALGHLVNGIVDESSFVFLISYQGTTVAEISDLRTKLYDNGAKCHVLKNSLLNLAFRDQDYTVPELSGDTAVVFGEGDPCPVAKTIKEFRKGSEFVDFKGAVVGGSFLTANDAAAMAELPSKEALQSQLLSVLQAPASNLARVLNAKLTSIVYVLQAYQNKLDNES